MRFVVLAVLVFLLPLTVQAQTGRLRGTVRDASGTALSGVTVRATNQRTALTGRATTGADGSYAITGLVAGAYTVAASMPGLRTVSQNVEVGSDQTVTLDLVLQAVTLEAVTVTAMLREQELAKVPFSIAAPTEQALRLRGADNIEAVAANVAGFSVQNLGPGQSTVAMRGASSGQIARDQPGVKEQVGAYLDESPVSLSLFTPDLDLFDVSRVEVLRGPQGTLFGAGSEAGTVRYITNQPELGGKARVFGEVAGNTIDGGNQGGNVKLGLNAPLGEKAALRVVGYYTRFAGYIDSPGIQRTNTGAIQPNPGAREEDVNTGDRTGVRVAAKFAPND